MSSKLKNEDAIILLSGGQDSVTALHWGLETFRSVSSISFYYKQRHNRELEAAEYFVTKYNLRHKTIDISFLADLVESDLFQGGGDINAKHKLSNKVPSSFVPFRNHIFLSLAACYGTTLGVNNIITGVCETDYSGYADCRDIFIKSLQVALNLSMDGSSKGIILHTPLMWLSKAEVFMMADDYGCLDEILKNTITCYNGSTKTNDYGMGCSECSACRLRAKGYKEFREKYGR